MKLPIGYDNFEDLRRDQCYYADKTKIIFDMLSKSRYHFLSRPRRFGKSVFLSTIQCFLEGKKELFKGLYIENKWDWSHKLPVVKICFNGDYKHPNDLEDDLNKQMKALEEEHGAPTQDWNNPMHRFRRIMRHLHKQTGERVSVLIDDYDHPFLNHFLNTEDLGVAEKNHDYLNSFYGSIEECSEDVGFIFITGVMEFSHRCRIGNGFDSFVDISLHERYGNACGFTDHEIDTVFAKEIKTLDRNKIRRWYGGYSWNDGEDKLYNPYDILKLLDTQKFEDWWFQKETSEFMYKRLLKKSSFSLILMESREGHASAGRERGELISFGLKHFSSTAIFFQLGYLSVAHKEPTIFFPKYCTSIPNLCVRNGIYKRLLDVLSSGNAKRAKDQGKALLDLLVKNDFSGFEKTLHSYFDSLSFIDELHERTRPRNHFHSLLITILYAMKSHYTDGNTINSSRTITIHEAGQIFCIKFTTLFPPYSGEKETTQEMEERKERLLLEAIYSIKKDIYIEKPRESKDPIHLLALVFVHPNRNFNGFKHEIFYTSKKLTRSYQVTIKNA
ncbi:MAG: AAA family ATPase [Proteobacteria bacterium]|nr:AAA family ATPase [Pseudomonadota bacterium]